LRLLFCPNHAVISLEKLEVPQCIEREEQALSAKKGPHEKSEGRVLKQAKKRQSDPKELSLNQRLIKALAHPLRVRILAYMNDREWSPNELSEELNEGLSQVSYHVKVLRDFEMIEQTRTEPRRGAVEHFYRAIERAYIPSWMAKLIPKSGKEIIGSNILEAIEEDLVASIKSGKFYERDDCHATYTPVVLDSLGCEEADEAANGLVRKLLEIEGKAANRRACREGDGECIPVSAGVLVFGSTHAKKRRVPVRKPSKKKR
jgi:DNA-binding transcriptional ArsR family regulator